ncbi:unnamed protein product [Albugo candida]|uniref:Uncharacterized protein n=1 Tax=Albugo candida TaxID=65357 RepID=A0A024G1D6_9STRA|nr:unnamed protein product [Albugo candida]|eukprot:CCI40579.1 unnamed protein product [Albugo candida]
MYRLFRKVKGNNKAGNENTPIVHECLTSETVFCGVEVDIYANRNYEVVATESVLTRNYVCQQQDSGILIECIRGTSGCYGWVHPTKRGLNVLLLA